jgi:ABC-type Fe3+/spermidine/putrescine transport system ATPase subunit
VSGPKTTGQVAIDAEVQATFTDADTRFALDAAVAAAPGETVAILGPSGSGKTLLLECLAGHHPHEGTVRVDGTDVSDDPPEDRRFGFVFQDYALLPHRSVVENVAFGQRYVDRPVAAPEAGADPGPADWPDDAAADRPDDDAVPLPHPEALLADLGVADLADRNPETLSGGESQRVALARSLAVRPAALLLDEPLSALDVPTREALRADLVDRLTDATAIYVTHNRTTARAVADRVVLMRDGRVVQRGPVESLFQAPETAFAAEFTGATVLRGAALGQEAEWVAVRPEHVSLAPPDAPDTVPASVERVLREDAAVRVTLALEDPQATVGDVVDDGTSAEDTSPAPAVVLANGGGASLTALVTGGAPDPGKRVGVTVPDERVVPVRDEGTGGNPE